MKLLKNLEHGSLLYLNKQHDAVSVSENEHYRWLCINEICQSIMLKRSPHKLVLPHQYAMMMPLLFCSPSKICEIGLGAGSFARFINKYLPESFLTSIETDKRIINSFYNYFPSQIPNHKIINHFFDASDSNINYQDVDWWLYDLYSIEDNSAKNTDSFESFLTQMPDQAVLSINITDSNENTINQYLGILKQHLTQYVVFYFEIPQYANVVAVALPKHMLTQTGASLSKTYHSRWRRLWQTGIQLR